MTPTRPLDAMMTAALVLAAALLNVTAARGGVFAEGAADLIAFGGGSRSWRIEDTSGTQVEVSQTAFPVRLRMPIRSSDLVLALEAIGVYSDLSGTIGGSLGSPTDTQLGLSYLLPDQRFLVSGGVSLPTGSTDLDEAQLNAARAVSNQILGFSTRAYGGGFDVFVSGSAAALLSDELSVGGTVRFRSNGTFQFGPRSDGDLRGDIGPGDEFTLSTGLSFRSDAERARPEVEPILAANLDATARFYTSDSVDGSRVFKQGNEFEIHATASRQERRVRSGLSMRLVLAADSAFENEATPLDLEDPLLNLILANVTGDRFEMGANISYGMTPVLRFGGVLAFKHFGEAVATIPDSEDGETFFIRQPAHTLELGPTLSWDQTRSLTIGARASYLLGSALDGNVGMNGYDVGASATYRF